MSQILKKLSVEALANGRQSILDALSATGFAEVVEDGSCIAVIVKPEYFTLLIAMAEDSQAVHAVASPPAVHDGQFASSDLLLNFIR